MRCATVPGVLMPHTSISLGTRTQRNVSLARGSAGSTGSLGTDLASLCSSMQVSAGTPRAKGLTNRMSAEPIAPRWLGGAA